MISSTVMRIVPVRAATVLSLPALTSVVPPLRSGACAPQARYRTWAAVWPHTWTLRLQLEGRSQETFITQKLCDMFFI